MSPAVGMQQAVSPDGIVSLTVHLPGKGMLGPINSTHPFFDKARAEAIKTDPDLDALADWMRPVHALAREFKNLSERVSFAHGVLFIDGDEAESDALTEQIVRYVESGTSDWRPLVAFLEKVMSNPNEHSRQQLYNWIRSHRLELTPDGDMIAYKGVETDNQGGWRSTRAGRALVNGVVHEGKIPNAVGDVVTMPRSEVKHDPHAACHSGLHIGTWEHAKSYASSYATGASAMFEVHVNPRDVVSVPTAAADKCRVCRYKVARRVVAPGVPFNDVNVTFTGSVTTTTINKVEHPTEQEFNNMLARAGRRRQNIEKYLTKHTSWRFVGDQKDKHYRNPKIRTHWVK